MSLEFRYGMKAEASDSALMTPLSDDSDLLMCCPVHTPSCVCVCERENDQARNYCERLLGRVRDQSTLYAGEGMR